VSADRWIPGRAGGPLILCDHASNLVPEGLDLGLPPALMETHIALDIGAGPLSEALAARLDAPAILGRWSRLVADCNRPIDHEGFVPASSDGIAIPGNRGLDPAARAAREAIHIAHHDAISDAIARLRPTLLVSVHSFTPALAADPAPRPWPVAILWNRDRRGAGPALAELGRDRRVGGPVGANEPYSGRILNYTMDRHGEAGGIPYIGFEVRQDGISDAEGVARWAEILGDCVAAVGARL
jgi:predicted N-formylglutamate amidohydrolase